MKPHWCHICETTDPTRFYGKMRGECYDCYSERKRIELKEKAVLREFGKEIKTKKRKLEEKKPSRRKKNSPRCLICRDENPAHFVREVRSLCSRCIAKHIV